MKVKDVTDYLESLAPRGYQESYDNSGLLTGEPSQEITGVLVTLDCTEAVVEEAIKSAPKTIDVYDRRGEPKLKLGEDRLRFGVGVTALFYQNPVDDNQYIGYQ